MIDIYQYHVTGKLKSGTEIDMILAAHTSDEALRYVSNYFAGPSDILEVGDTMTITCTKKLTPK